MIVGIKYCGGCNCTYDRGREVERLKGEFPDAEFLTGAPEKKCDLYLMVCGCHRACIRGEEYQSKGQILILASRADFSKASGRMKELRELRQERKNADDPKKREKKVLYLGQTAQMSRSFFKDDVERFAALTGDYNRIHLDAAYARDTRYGRPIVHGVLTASLISTLMGTVLPGEGTILLEERLSFLKAVFYGERITAQVRLESCVERRGDYVAVLKGRCLNAQGQTAVEAECTQLLSKEYFAVKTAEEEERA